MSDEQDLGYDVGTWHDYEQMRCKMCPYKTVGDNAKADIEQHVQAHYSGMRVVPRSPMEEPRSRRSRRPIAGPDGEPLPEPPDNVA